MSELYYEPEGGQSELFHDFEGGKKIEPFKGHHQGQDPPEEEKEDTKSRKKKKKNSVDGDVKKGKNKNALMLGLE